jgi:hypothetical protein
MLVSIVRIRRVRRDLREYAYLEHSDPAASDALVRAHQPTMSRATTRVLASLVLLGLLAALVVIELTGGGR